MAFGGRKKFGMTPEDRKRLFNLRRLQIMRGTQPQVTAANAPLYQARQRLGAKREMMDAYFGAPTLRDAMWGSFPLKDKEYKNKMAYYFQKYYMPRRPKDWWRHK